MIEDAHCIVIINIQKKKLQVKSFYKQIGRLY